MYYLLCGISGGTKDLHKMQIYSTLFSYLVAFFVKDYSTEACQKFNVNLSKFSKQQVALSTLYINYPLTLYFN